MNRKGKRSRRRELSLEPLEARILLGAVNPGEVAELTAGDQLFFVQGENSDTPTDGEGTVDDMVDEWVIIATYEGPGSVQFYDSEGDNTILNGGKIGDLYFSHTTSESNLYIQRGVFVGDFGTGDIPNPDSPVSFFVRLNYNNQGQYVWWTGQTPWMNSYFEGGERQNVFAPDGSGVAAVTGNIHFADNCTGFGTFALDGSLKGTFGYEDQFGTVSNTLDSGENVDQIMVGYVNSQQTDSLQGTTVGGINVNGSINRVLVRTTVAELGAANRVGQSDRWDPALIHVGGYLMDFQVSGTILADIDVEGVTDPVDIHYDYDYGWPFNYPERPLGEGNAGIISDDASGAYTVGSPSGDFTIEGRAWELGGNFREDPQDWYAFTPGLGNEITVDMTTGTSWPTWIIAPSGRVVGVAEPEESVTFTADEGGAYYLVAGRPPADQDPRMIDRVTWSMDYELSVTGTRPVQLGGLIVGSNLMTNADTSGGLELGDDVLAYSTYTFDYAGVEANDVGIIDVRGSGGLGAVDIWAWGNLGYLTAAETDTAFVTSVQIEVSGDLDRLESRTGDLSFSWLDVGGNVGEIYTPGDLSQMQTTAQAFITGHLGSLVAEGDYLVQTSVYSRGVDLFYVGGDFGTPINYARLDTASGADVGFAHVVGTIYDQGDIVYPVTVNDRTESFTDDGGSTIYMKPIATRSQVIQDGLQQRIERVAPSLQYRFLPIGRTDGEAAGSVLTEIIASDGLTIGLPEQGSVDLPYITVGSPLATDEFRSASTELVLQGGHRLAELDVYYVQSTLTQVPRIANLSHQGDIVNVNVTAAGRIYAAGHIGLSDRQAVEAGRLPNPTPTTFTPTAVPFVSEDEPVYFNGVVASGRIDSILAGGSIGDVYAGDIGVVRADVDNEPNSPEFIFRTMPRAERTWDGIAGVVYSADSIELVDPGSGLFGGQGEVPVGGVFAEGQIETLSATNSVIAGPVMAGGLAPVLPGASPVLRGIGLFRGYNTTLQGATVGAGAEFSDWAMWDEIHSTTDGVRAGNIVLRGPHSGIDQSRMQVGVLNNLFLGVGTQGLVDSYIYAIGDQNTEEGINRITILGGGMNGTNAPPYRAGQAWDIHTNQRMGPVTLSGADVDMLNMDIRSLKDIRSIRVQGDILADTTSRISAPLGINVISADNITGTGVLDIGTGELNRLIARGQFGADANVDGPVGLLYSGGSFTGSFTTQGPHGSIQRAVVRGDMPGIIDASNYLGSLVVSGGDLSGTVMAHGSNGNDLAIGSLVVSNGDLGQAGDYAVLVVTSGEAVRRGGGIGRILVNGNIEGDITTTSSYDAAAANAVPADIGLIRVYQGDVNGDVTIRREDPGNGNDPGGVLRNLVVWQGELNGDLDLDGGAGRIVVSGGTVGGAIDVTRGDAGRIVILSNRTPAVTNDIDVAGNLGLLRVVGGDVNGDLTVGGKLQTLWLAADSDMGGMVTAGAIGRAYFMGPAGITNPVQATRHIGTILSPSGTTSDGPVSAGDGLGLLRTRSQVGGDITVDGDVGAVDVLGGNLSGFLSVSNGSVGRVYIWNGYLRDVGGTDPGIQVSDGDLELLRIYHPEAPAVGNEIIVDNRLERAVIVGDVNSSVTVGNDEAGDGAGWVTVRGNIGESEQPGQFTVAGDVTSLSVIDGQIADNDSPDERVRITGDVEAMRVTGYTGGGSVIEDDIYVGDRLALFVVNGGRFDGRLTAGSMGTVLYYTPTGIVDGASGPDLYSRGNLDLLRTVGPILGSVQVDHHAGTIVAAQGVAAGATITAGSGVSGDGLENLAVRGDLLGDVTVNGNLARVSVTGNLGSLAGGASVDVNGGKLDRLAVLGDMIQSTVDVDGTLGSAFVGRSFSDHPTVPSQNVIDANELGRVVIRGTLAGRDGDDEIHASIGRFDLFATGIYYDIDGASQNINGVQAYVG